MWYHQLDPSGCGAHGFIGGGGHRQWTVLCCLLSAASADVYCNSFGVCRHLLAGMIPFVNEKEYELTDDRFKRPVSCFIVTSSSNESSVDCDGEFSLRCSGQVLRVSSWSE